MEEFSTIMNNQTFPRSKNFRFSFLSGLGANFSGFVGKMGLLLLVAMIPARGVATTWDEPWMDKVITNAESFVLATVLENHPGEFKAKVVKQLAGVKTPNEVQIRGFSLLHLGSLSDKGEVEFDFKTNSSYYFFLRRSTEGTNYLIATPTTGWAKITDKGVNATYRHSYHQAIVPQEIYETTIVAIFNRIHGIKGDEDQAKQYVKKELKKTPATTKPGTEDGLREFFLQHAALETFAYVGSEEELSLIDPFLNTGDFHVQISAVRAISHIRSEHVTGRLMDFIEGEHYGFAKVMAVWGLKEQEARNMLPRLKKFLESGKNEETGFGGNIMDPRVGTRFPGSVKSAINQLIRIWEQKAPGKPAESLPERSGKAKSTR
jgi:hypothetical protein